MTRPRRSLAPAALVAIAAGTCTPPALACASCGCTLSSDWESQGFSVQPGFKVDLRYDYLDQSQLRSGTRAISSEAASKVVTAGGDPQEVERYTRNQYLTLGIDYAFSPDWGLNVQIPFVDRKHSTLGVNSDGGAPAEGAYDSATASFGDAKLVGRYQGLSAGHNTGLIFGVKLPTGSHTRTGTSTDPASPGEPATIDRGLQPGTGTTDAILGVYRFDSLAPEWGYFAQATVQAAIDSRDDYRPGTGYNLNLGVRYSGFGAMVPQLQLNARYVEHDRGANADQTSTGGTLVYLSPGLVVPLSRTTAVYGFVQLPLYQDVRGVQLTPRYTASLGVRLAF